MEEPVRPGPWQSFDAWAPDSSAFLYSEAEIDGSGAVASVSLLRYDVVTRSDRVVATPGRGGTWSADGSLIAYVTEATEERPCGEAGAEQACTAVLDVASGEEQYRFAGPPAFEVGEARLPEFLPDGRLLYITPEGNLGLADAVNSTVLHEGGANELGVSPDGRMLLIREVQRLLVVPIPEP
ncbi:MAG: PD40 domain-containing protein [Proteobacteria bacterium]|nr:PD40 domain-containing protein [Pseudomonadota bacterium]